MRGSGSGAIRTTQSPVLGASMPHVLFLGARKIVFNFSTIPWKMKSRNVPQRSLFATYQSFAANFTVDNAGAANAVNLLP